MTTPDDIDAIARIHVRSWNETYAGIFPADYLGERTEKVRRETWSNWFESASELHRAFVAEAAGDVVGFCSLGPARRPDLDAKLEVYAIYVEGQYQSRGLGGALWDAACKTANKLGARTLSVSVLSDNDACSFYEHVGGELVGREVRTYGGRELELSTYAFQLNATSDG
jgi:L-amino acid N-acyltransferase YncA